MSQIQVEQVKPAKKRRTRRKRATGGQTADAMCPICTPYTSEADAKVPTKDLVSVIIQTAQMISGIQFYPYQITPAARLVESVLLHEGATVTALFSRQSGKTEMVAAILAAMAILLPVIANDPEFERDWRFNLTDEQGRYRGFKNGISVGIYAPKLEQAQIQFRRLMKDLKTDAAKEILEELGIECDTWNRDTVRLTNGSEIRACSASEQSKVEGSTHDILALEEAQDISSRKIKKSLRPMIAATKGTTMAVGTATTQKGEFHHMIKANMERRLQGGKQDHFEYNWLTAAAYNSLYGDFVKQEMDHYGADSDEFRMSYLCEWVLERGQFVTPDQLFAPIVCVKGGRYSLLGKADANLYQAAGIDFGKGQSSTVVTVVEVDWDDPTICQAVESFSSEGNAYFEAYTKSIIDWLEIQGDNYEIQFAAIVDYLLKIPNLQKISVDATGLGAVLLDRFITEIGDRVEVEGVVLTAPRKSEGYKILHTDIVSGRFKFPAGQEAQKDKRWKRFVHQMLDLQKSYTGDLMKCHCPDEKSARDDYCDSAMLANLAANTPPVGSVVEVHQENFLFA